MLSKAALETMEEIEAKGKRPMLLRLLERRFGLLPGEVHRRVNGADAAQLDIWFDRVLDGWSIEEAFGPIPDEPASDRTWPPGSHPRLPSSAMRTRGWWTAEGKRVASKALFELMREGWEEGWNEGWAEGVLLEKSADVLRLVEQRFGAVPQDLRQRIEGADERQLDLSSDRIVDAGSLEEFVCSADLPHSIELRATEGGWQADRESAIAERATRSKAGLKITDESRAKGVLLGRQAFILDLVEQRFGVVPRYLRQRIENTDGTQLDLWFDHVLDARSIEEIFDPTRG